MPPVTIPIQSPPVRRSGSGACARAHGFWTRTCSLVHSHAVRSLSVALATWLTVSGASTMPLGATPRAGAKDEGAVSVTSDPSGAAVFIDGAFVGRTPLTVPALAAGDHRLRLVKDDYLENSHVVNIDRSKTATIRTTLTARAMQNGPGGGLQIVVIAGEDAVN